MTYRRCASPLHAARAGVAAAWCVVLGLVAFSLEQPLVLATLLACVVAAAALAGVGRPVARSLAWGVPFALVIAVVNTLVTQAGLTVLFRGSELPVLGRVDVTLEALVYSAILSLRFLIVIGCAGLLAAAVDPDELLRAMRRASARSGVTAAVATRLMPVLARDARRLAEAQRCRGTADAGRVAVLRAVTTGALDRATDVAATLELRGFASGRRPARRPRPWSRHDIAFCASALGLGTLGVANAVEQWAAFDALPRLGDATVGSALVMAAALAVVALAPFADRRGIEPWRVLELDGVTYAYPGERAALSGVSLSVEPGEFVVVSGGSGSGKSTLLRAAAGLVPHFHGGTFAGRLACGGLDTREHGPGDIAAVAGTLLQDPETQVLMGTVRAELAFPLENRGDGAAAVARGVEEAALALGIAGLLDRSTHELSGGELQRVALGAALAGRPRIVLLDEPTSQLDPVAGDELLGVLRRVNEEWGTAVLLAEHRLERCLPAADRVIALEDGRVAFDGSPEAFLRRRAETPIARLFELAGRAERPVSVKAARRALGAAPPGGVAAAPGIAASGIATRERGARRVRGGDALALERVWFEREAAVLRGVNLRVAPGEIVALMGRNGAGKSTLLRIAAGMLSPTRGKVRAVGRVALLLQNPGDYFLHERVDAELPQARLDAGGLGHLAERHPRDLSGGERQRLALEIVLGDEPSAIVCLDEPTRGMDRGHKDRLAARLRELARDGTAVIVATHDAELAAALAARTVLLGDGRPVADAPTAEVLGGGWYFATQTARVLGGGALTPEQGAALIATPEVAVT